MCRINFTMQGGYFAEVIPDGVADDMLAAEADVIEPRIHHNADVMLLGEYSTGLSREKLTRLKPSRNRDGERQLLLTWRGTRDYYLFRGERHRREEVRNAEIAFINEYGSRKTPARGFIKAAIDDGEKEAVDGAEKIFRRWQDEKF